MRDLLYKTGDDMIVQVGYVANVPYFLCYGLEALGVPCYNIVPQSILRSKYARIFYGSIYNGNPLKVNLLIVDDATYDHFILSVLRILEKMKRRYRNLIVHLHIGSALRDHFILKLISKILNFRVFVHMHGTDLRDLIYSKAEILKIIHEEKPWFVSTPDLLTYCKHLNIKCIWLHNPIDPIIFSELKLRTKPWNTGTIRVFIPTRFDHTKGLNVFFDLLVNALSKNPKLLNDCILYTIVWPGTTSAMHHYIQLLRNKGIKMKLLPLLSRKELLEIYHRSNIVIGQFVLGVLSLTELEAPALQNYVIIKPLDAVTRFAYRSYFGMQKIPVSEIRNSDDLMNFLTSIPHKANLEGAIFVERIANPFNISKELSKYYQKLG